MQTNRSRRKDIWTLMSFGVSRQSSSSIVQRQVVGSGA